MKKAFIITLLAVGLINAEENKAGYLKQAGNFFVNCKDIVVNGFGSVASVVTDTEFYEDSKKFVGDVYTNYGAPVVNPTVKFLTETKSGHITCLVVETIVATVALKTICSLVDKIKAKSSCRYKEHIGGFTKLVAVLAIGLKVANDIVTPFSETSI